MRWLVFNALFCELARLCVRAFCRKVLSLFLSSLEIPQFGLLSHISSLTLSSGHSSLVLTLRTHDDAASTSLSSPCSLVVDACIWATFLLAIAVRSLFSVCVCVCVFLPGYVAL